MIVNVLFYFVFSLPASRSGGTATKIYSEPVGDCFLSVESETWFSVSVHYAHDCTPNVVAIAVSTVMIMLRTLPQVVLLLNVPIVYSVLIIHYKNTHIHRRDAN